MARSLGFVFQLSLPRLLCPKAHDISCVQGHTLPPATSKRMCASQTVIVIPQSPDHPIPLAEA